MGYLFVALALLSGGIKSFCGKKISGKTPTIKNAILTNFVRMLFCIVFGFLFVWVIDGVSALKMDAAAILLALGGSVATCVFLVSWLLAMRKNAYMTVEAFVLASMLVPVLLKLAIYDEKVGIFQWIGLAILLFSVWLMSIYNNQTKGKLTAVGLALLFVVCLVSCGNQVDKTGLWENAKYLKDTEFGTGATTVQVEVKVEEQSVMFTIHTDKSNLGDALLEHNLIAGEEGAYGLYIKEVNV